MFSGACQKSQTENSRSLVKIAETPAIYNIENLVAWCVVPFDSEERGPAARVDMLRDLGFTKFAYDWRDQHLPGFPQEVGLLNQNQIELTAVWWWIDGQGEDLLNSGNQKLLHYLDSLDISCDIWMSFSDGYFDGLDDAAKLDRAVESVKLLHQKAGEVDCKLMLYNHGSWFGDPNNQVAIIEKSGLDDIGIVYNFHHAHQQIEQFPELLKAMLPYLNTVNINGMNEDGPKILTVGQGHREAEMLQVLAASGFEGHIGIIGHLEEEDVAQVLKRNIQGLEQIVKSL
jgi:hypothetical protein